MFSGANKSTTIANEWNFAQLNVGDIGTDPVDRRVALPVHLVAVVVLVPRRRLVDHK